MLHDLNKSLAELLRRELPAGIVGGASISFVPPDDNFPPQSITLPAINIFLCEVHENAERRRSEPYVEIANVVKDARGNPVSRQVIQQRPPLWLDCHYLITVWPNEGSQGGDEDAYQILGAVVKVLMRHRELPIEAMVGEFKGKLPLPRAAATAPESQRRGSDLWQALKGRPRPFFHYAVTLCTNVFEPTVEEQTKQSLDLQMQPVNPPDFSKASPI